MSPKAELKEFFYQEKPESPRVVQSIITIDLNDPAIFDPANFDELVKASMKPEYGIYNLKYIAQGDKVYVFPSQLRHSKAFGMLKNNGVTGELQSAGYVGVKFEDDGRIGRILDQHASTLVGLLSEERSNLFKNTVLKEKLGEHFQVS